MSVKNNVAATATPTADTTAPDTTPTPTATPTAEKAGISINFNMYESDRAAAAALRQVAVAVYLVRDFLDTVPGGGKNLEAVAEILASLIPAGKKVDLHSAARAAARYVG